MVIVGILPLSCDVDIVAWAFLQIITGRKRSCGKVMILHLSVSHSVCRGEGVCLSVCCDMPPPPGRYPAGRHPLGKHDWVDTPHQMPPSQHTATVVDGTHPTGMLSCCNLCSYTIELSIIPCNVFARVCHSVYGRGSVYDVTFCLAVRKKILSRSCSQNREI